MIPEYLEQAEPTTVEPVEKLGHVRAIGLLNNWEIFGHEKGCIEWFKSLRRQGADVVVGVTRRKEGNALKELLEENDFATFELPFGCQWSKRFFANQPSLIFDNIIKVFRCSSALSKAIKRQRATHVLIGNPLVYSFVAPALSYHSKVKLVYRVGDEPAHGSIPHMWIWRNCFRRAHAVVANSRFIMSSIYRAVGPNEKIHLIYNVAPEAGNSYFSQLDATSRPNRTRVLYVGQISSHKGVDLLVDVAIRLCKSKPNFHFDIVGGSLYSQTLQSNLRQLVSENGLSDRIVFHGQVADPRKFYESSDVLVVPSLFEEPAANVVLEAKRLGVPSIVFPKGGLPELVKHGHSGLICDSCTPQALENAIARLCGDAALQSEMKKNCKREYVERFSAERFDGEWQNVIIGS